MFSLFGKKKDVTQDVIHPLLKTELQKIEFMPKEPGIEVTSKDCVKRRLEGSLPNAYLVDVEVYEALDSAFLVKTQGDEGVAFVNNRQSLGVELYRVNNTNTEKVELEDKVDINLDVKQSEWLSHVVTAAACLTQNQLALAISYWNPRHKHAIYIYDVVSNVFTKLADVETGIPNIERVFEVKRISQDATLLVYYTDKKRKAAEIYHNYYHHIVFFDGANKDGLELIKLGIDTGNVVDWKVIDKKLFLKTMDNRDPKSPRVGYWSLDLSQLIK